MTIKRNIFTFITMIVALVAFSVAVVAQDTRETKKEGAKKEHRMGGENFHGKKGGKHGGRGFRGGHGRAGMVHGLHKLELNESQKSQIQTLKETHKNGQMPYFEEMRALKMKMRDGSASDGDKTRMEELRTASKASSDQLKTTILGVLTPDQLQKLETMKVERQQMMEERKQRWMERKQQKPAEPLTKTVG